MNVTENITSILSLYELSAYHLNHKGLFYVICHNHYLYEIDEQTCHFGILG